MKTADANGLAALVQSVFVDSGLQNDFDGVEISTGELDETNDFLRVRVHLRNLKSLSDTQVESITTAIEKTISEHDDRFASVRYAET